MHSAGWDPPSSANAIAFADALRFSILEEAADSDRSRIAANGAMSAPISASKRAISAVASATRTSVSPGSGTKCYYFHHC